MAEEKRGSVALVFAGVRETSNKKLAQCFYKVLTDGSHEKKQRSYTKIKAVGRPGGMYQFDCDAEDDSTVYPASMSYTGYWDDEDTVCEWQARHDAANSAARARRRQKRETGRNIIHERLEPIRDAYHKCVGMERNALLAQVVAYISGRSK